MSRRRRARTQPATAAQVAATLTQPAVDHPPTYLQLVRELGDPVAAAARVNRWMEYGQNGHFSDPKFAPSPQPASGAA